MVLLEGASLASLGGGRLCRSLGVVVEAGEDVARRRRFEILALFALDGLFAGGLLVRGQFVREFATNDSTRPVILEVFK